MKRCVGANLQDNLIDVIIRFRLHNIAITTDLRKMYRQVLVHEDDRDFQQILWRFDESQSICKYRLNTVTYGLASAPFLAIRCIKQLATENRDRYVRASQALLRNLYVDDILTEGNCESTALSLIHELREILKLGGFEPQNGNLIEKKF